MRLINKLLLGSVIFFASIQVFASPITMYLQNTCGFKTSDLEVAIWNPPGGYANVNTDQSVSLNIPSNTKVQATVAPSYCAKECSPYEYNEYVWVRCQIRCDQMTAQKFVSPWTPAKHQGSIQVVCNN